MSISHFFSPLKEPENAGVKLPKINLDPSDLKDLGLEVGAASVDVLKALAKKGLRKRGITRYENREEYYKRAKEEIDILEDLGFTDYVLGCWEITNEAHKRGAVIGKGRGSAGSSLVFSLLDITDVDAVKYNLFFERFVSRSRSKRITDSKGDVWLDGGLLPDCDLDFEKHVRGDIIQWIKERHKGRNAKILTFNTFSSRLAVKEASKFFSDVKMEEDDLTAVSDMVPKLHGVVEDLEKAVEEERFGNWRKKNGFIYENALLIEDLKKNTGVHPSGIAIAHDTIADIIPIRVTFDEETGEETETTAYAMGETADLAVKYDILGLRTLTIIDGTAKRAGISFHDIDPEDKEIYRYLQNFEHPYGLFQISADTNYVVTKKVKPWNLSELSDVVALARPGALALVDDYVRNKDIPNPTGLNEEFDRILGRTKNVLIYQEQIMQILNKVYGFSLEDAELVRKIVGKKLRDKMPEWEGKIREAGERLGVDKKLTDYYWKALLDSADYSFNCLAADTMLELEGGEMIRIDQVKAGQRIRAYNFHTKKDYYAEIKATFVGEKELTGVVFVKENGETTYLHCSMDHPFFLSKNGKKSIKIGELLKKEGKREIFCGESGKMRIYCSLFPMKDESWDLEMADENHCFYANGILTHNCSHSLAYSKCSAISVFLKIKYPTEFFTECLTNAKYEQKPFEEIAAIQRELPDFGISLLPPSLQYSENEFTIEGKNIRYGLSSIKGIAEKKRESLDAFRNAPRKTKYDVFMSAKECGIPINVLVNLIYAGTMEGQNRSLLALEAQVWNVFTDREKRNFCLLGERYNYDLLKQIVEVVENKVLADDGKILIKDSRFKTIKEKSAGYRAMYEKNLKYESLCAWWAEHSLLGYVHSKKLRECVKMADDLYSIKEVKDEVGPGGRFQLVGILEDFFVRTSKKGNKYAKFTVADEETNIEVMLCDSVDNKKLSMLIAQNEVPAKQDIIIVYGSKSREGDTCFVDSIKIIENPISLKVAKTESAA